jgi:hypothetical protein
MKMLIRTLPALAGILLVVAGCSRMPTISIPNPLDAVAGPSVLSVEVAPGPGAIPLLRNGQTLSLSVAEFADARPAPRGRKIGDIKATVTNMHGSEMALDRDVTSVVSGAARGQLAADGFRLVGAAEPADFRLSGVVKAFSLTVAGRDERVIVVEATVREGKSGDVVWSGVITEKDDRYAGVTGNSRGTLIEYLGEGVAAFATKLSAATRDSLVKSYPRSIAAIQSRSVSTIPGVTTLHAPATRDDPVVVAPAPAAATVAPAAAPAARPATTAAAVPTVGYVSVHSSPARVKVYVDDVYYGVTPIKLELPTGVAQLGFKLDGYRPAAEKVAVRRGEVTDLEVKLVR